MFKQGRYSSEDWLHCDLFFCICWWARYECAFSLCLCNCLGHLLANQLSKKKLQANMLIIVNYYHFLSLVSDKSLFYFNFFQLFANLILVRRAYFQKIQLYNFIRQMNSNSKEQTINTLYVRQFFEHFYQKRSMLQVLTSISNGIQVLDALITDFQSQKGLRRQHRSPTKKQITPNGDFVNVVLLQGNAANMAIQELYSRLQAIFKQCQSNKSQKHLDSSVKPFNTFESSKDDELYDMLNDYKADNKKQKELRKKAENQAFQLRKEINKLQEEKTRINIMLRDTKSQLSSSNKKNIELQGKIEALHEEINSTSEQRQKLNEQIIALCHLSENKQQIEKQNKQLADRLKKSQERQALLSKKFNSLDQIVNSRILDQNSKWVQMLETKLTSKTLFEKSSCSALREFIKNVQGIPTK